MPPPTPGRELVERPPESLNEKRRLLLLVRTGLSLAIAYLLIFSTDSEELPLAHLTFVVVYLGSNLLIALAPSRILQSATFDASLVLIDTAATSFALYLIPEANTDVFVFYFVIVLLASISDRLSISVLAPVVTSLAYLAFLLARYGVAEVMRPGVLLRLPFFLLVGAFYGFFVDRVRRGQIAAAAAAERAQARTEFLSLITHDLKQPLWVADRTAAELYERVANRSGEERALAARIIVNLRRMEALTLNFLELSRIESRGVQIFPQKGDVNLVVEDLVDSYRPALELKGQRLNLELDPSISDAWIDAAQLQRALANLCDNAVKFTQEGGQVVCRTAAAGDVIEITVGDSGPGIGAERGAELFSHFQVGDHVAGRRSTGLGLYIAHAIVVAHGGEIALEEGHERGAWFRIRLPAGKPEAADAALPTRESIVLDAQPSLTT